MHPNDNRGYLSLRDRVMGDFFPLCFVYVCVFCKFSALGK